MKLLGVQGSMIEPEYSTYSLEELRDVLESIDRERFPDRYLKAKSEIEKRKMGVLPSKRVRPEIPADKKEGKTSARGLVLAIWPATVLLSIYFGKLPSRNGFIIYDENPGLFVVCIMIFIGVGIYFYNCRDGT